MELFDRSRDPEMKLSIVRSLAGRADASTFGKLVSIAKADPDARVRQQAVELLAVAPVGRPGAVPGPFPLRMVPPPLR